MGKYDNNYSVRAVERAINILQVFSYDRQELSLVEIASEILLPKSTVFRILLTLEQHNLVVQDAESGKYRLGYELIKLGEIAKESNPLGKLLYDEMKAVSKATGQTCNLYVRDGYERVCIAQAVGTGYVRRHSYLGARQPLYCGAGKLLLAYADPSFQNSFFGEVTLEQFTEKTVTNLEDLKADLEKIRRDGYSVTLGERDATTAMVAVPIRDYTGNVIANITISGPVYMFTDENVKTYIDELNSARDQIEKKLAVRKGV